jgi:predicted LPLAT superfamily acyltransferase
MPSWQGKSKGTKSGYSIFVFVLRNFGIKSSYFLLRFVAAYYFLFSIKSSKAIFHFFHSKMGFSGFKSLKKIYSNYFIFGQTLIDKVAIMLGMTDYFTFHFDGEENLKKMVSTGKGGILLSAHIGNWEAAGDLLKRLNTKIHIVMYDGEHRRIKDYLDEVTGKRNVNIIVIKDQISHIYEISEAFSRNELICMHADRFLAGSRTISHDYLGEEAMFPLGPFILATKFKVPVSHLFAMKEGKTHYHFFASPAIEYHSDRETGVKNALSDYVKEMENKVRRYPEQWFNYYNFWKKEWVS